MITTKTQNQEKKWLQKFANLDRFHKLPDKSSSEKKVKKTSSKEIISNGKVYYHRCLTVDRRQIEPQKAHALDQETEVQM